MSDTEMMRAALVRELSDDLSTLKVEDLPLPPVGAGEVRVRVKSAAVNYPDVLMVKGGYQFKPPLPYTPGMEGAGLVDAVGEGTQGFAVGDEVMIGNRFGVMAQYVSVPSMLVQPKAKALSFDEAAGFSTIAMTAYVALAIRANLQAGETLLVHGAGGGVGIAAVELGKHMGARVIATASSEDKRQLALAKGADHVIDVTKGFREQVKELTGGQGADVIFDPVGGDVFDESTRCINFSGRLLVIGFASGRIPTIAANIPLIKGFAVMGVRAGEITRRQPELGREIRKAVREIGEQGIIRPPVSQHFALDEVKAAFQTLDDRRALGKVIVRP